MIEPTFAEEVLAMERQICGSIERDTTLEPAAKSMLRNWLSAMREAVLFGDEQRLHHIHGHVDWKPGAGGWAFDMEGVRWRAQ
jgi:hypothetical protein